MSQLVIVREMWGILSLSQYLIASSVRFQCIAFIEVQLLLLSHVKCVLQHKHYFHKLSYRHVYFDVIPCNYDVSVVKCNTLVILEELPFLASTSATFHFLICLEDISSTTVAHSKWFRYFRRFLWVDLLYLLKLSKSERFRLSSKGVLIIS